MRFAFLIVGVLMLGLMPGAPLSIGQASAHEEVQYDLRYVAAENGNAPWLEVTATYTSDGAGFVSLYLPMERVQRGTNISRLSGLEVLSDHSELTPVGGNQYLFYFAPDGTGVLRYRISGIGDVAPNFASPRETAQLVTGRFVYLDAAGSLALPSWVANGYDWDEEIAVRLNWIDLPRGWTAVDSYGRGHETRQFRTSVIDLFESRFIAGDIQTASRTVSGVRLQVALFGHWDFSARQYANQLAGLARAQHEFWGDETAAGYLAALIAVDDFPDDGNLPSRTANASTNGSVIFAAQSNSLFSLKSTISHEYLHRWIDNAFGQAAPPHQATRWFTEGFTNFYAAYIPYRAGVIDRGEYLLWLAEIYVKRNASRYRNLTQDQMVEAWDYGNALTSVPYWRGHLLAANWHTEIANATGGEVHLHDILFEFRAAQDALRASGEPWVWDSESLISLLEARGFDFVRDDYAQILIGGADVPLTQSTNGPCIIPVHRPNQENNPGFFPAGYLEDEEMSVEQRAACRIWLAVE